MRTIITKHLVPIEPTRSYMVRKHMHFVCICDTMTVDCHINVNTLQDLHHSTHCMACTLSQCHGHDMAASVLKHMFDVYTHTLTHGVEHTRPGIHTAWRSTKAVQHRYFCMRICISRSSLSTVPSNCFYPSQSLCIFLLATVRICSCLFVLLAACSCHCLHPCWYVDPRMSAGMTVCC